jgi:glycine betaine/choline ABC-type transport system substrate-binding protein
LSSADSRAWRLGVGYEFLTRLDGLARLNQVYSLHWEGTAKTMDLGLLYQALGQGKIDMAAANSTDGMLENPKFTPLVDDKKAFPPYNACFVVREEVAKQHPEIKWALTMLSGNISDKTMRELNRRVDVLHQPLVNVVRDFLANQP